MKIEKNWMSNQLIYLIFGRIIEHSQWKYNWLTNQLIGSIETFVAWLFVINFIEQTLYTNKIWRIHEKVNFDLNLSMITDVCIVHK